jgi:hypothetical protein
MAVNDVRWFRLSEQLFRVNNVPGEFQEGHELDDKTAKKVPKAMIGRVLSRKEATRPAAPKSSSTICTATSKSGTRLGVDEALNAYNATYARTRINAVGTAPFRPMAVGQLNKAGQTRLGPGVN